MKKIVILLLLILPILTALQAQNCDPDTEGPTMVCINGLAVTLNPLIPQEDVDQDGILDSLSLSIWAQDLIILGADATRDNCTAEIDFRIELIAGSSGEEAPPSQAILLTEENEAITLVRIWGGDQAGNWQFCESYILIQTVPIVRLIQSATGKMQAIIGCKS